MSFVDIQNKQEIPEGKYLDRHFPMFTRRAEQKEMWYISAIISEYVTETKSPLV